MKRPPLPEQYRWLDAVPAKSRMLSEALDLYGVLEAPGTADNPVILRWAEEVGGSVEDVYKSDAVPWCGLYMAVVANRAGYDAPANPLWALSWSAFGRAVDAPALGDVLTFVRRDAHGRRIGGHVGLYVGEDDTAFHVLGGNQSDRVSIARISRGSNFYGARRPIFRVGQPPSVTPRRLAASGSLEANLA